MDTLCLPAGLTWSTDEAFETQVKQEVVWRFQWKKEMLWTWLSSRHFEDGLTALRKIEGKTHGMMVLATGQEAVDSGACAALALEDAIIITNCRSHSHLLAEGRRTQGPDGRNLLQGHRLQQGEEQHPVFFRQRRGRPEVRCMRPWWLRPSARSRHPCTGGCARYSGTGQSAPGAVLYPQRGATHQRHQGNCFTILAPQEKKRRCGECCSKVFACKPMPHSLHLPRVLP